MGSNSKRLTAWTWRQIEATRLRSWFLILTLDFTLFAIFVFVVCSSRPSIRFETVKATFPQKKNEKINDNNSINVQNMAPRCFRCEGRQWHNLALGTRLRWRTALYQSSRECRSDCTKIFVIVTLIIASFYNFFCQILLRNDHKLYSILKTLAFGKLSIISCVHYVVNIWSRESGPFQFHTRWLCRSAKCWLKNESTIDHICMSSLYIFLS